MDRNKIILDTQTPPDFGGVFDGDSFGEMEFLAWCRTAPTYPSSGLVIRTILFTGSKQ